MRKEFVKKFKDLVLLNKAIEEYKLGGTLASLGKLYGVDRSTIRYWIRKFHITRDTNAIIKLPRKKKAESVGTLVKRVFNEKFERLPEDRMNEGHNYAFYLEGEAKKGQKIRRF